MKIAVTLVGAMMSLMTYAQNNQFTVSGTATKLVDADEMILNVGYQTEGKDAQQIFRETQEKMNEAIRYLEGLKGVKRVETDVVRLNRKYNKNVPMQFGSAQTLSVTLSDFSLYEEVMVKLMDIGFNTVGGVRFAVSDMAKHKREVQLQAIAAAREKANAYAQALEVELGALLHFSENQLGGGPNPVYNYRAAEGGGTSGPSIAPRQVEITIQVVVSYAIK